MKKLMIATILTTIALCAGAELNTNSTEEEFEAVANAMLACSNADSAVQIAKSEKFFYMSNEPRLALFRKSYDAKLAEKFSTATKKKSLPVKMLPTWPEVAELACAARGATTETPYTYGKAKEFGCCLTPIDVANNGIEVAAGVLSEMVVKRSAYFSIYSDMTPAKGINAVKRSIQRQGEKAIRKWLRRHGKSFVTKDGVNPCAEKMDALTAALNTPRLAGLNEWFEGVELSCRVDLTTLPTAAEIDALKTAVLDGAKELTPQTTVELYLCLGVDGYNAFVKEYNGD